MTNLLSCSRLFGSTPRDLPNKEKVVQKGFTWIGFGLLFELCWCPVGAIFAPKWYLGGSLERPRGGKYAEIVLGEVLRRFWDLFWRLKRLQNGV